jgi:hypothetical protein
VSLDHARARELAWVGSIDAARDMARRATGSVVHDECGVVLIKGPHPLPVLINAVARVDPNVPAAEVLERANDFFGGHGRGYNVMGLEDRDEDLIAASDAAGMVAFGEPAPLMAITEPPARVDVPAGMRIERVTTAAQVDAVIDISNDAYAVYGMPGDVAPAVMRPPSVVLAPHIAAYLAVDDEGPVATAQSIATYGTAYLQWVGTRQRAFGRRAGPAVTQAATIGGFELGASMATLVASAMGAPIYRKLGWSDVGRVVSRVQFTPPAA